VSATNKRWGPLFGYTGSFQVDWKQMDAATVPNDLLPRRTERRE